MRTLLGALSIAGLLALSGCSWDYLNHSDSVSYAAGNAVKANLAQQATNPYAPYTRDTTGLGKNGSVVPTPVVVE